MREIALILHFVGLAMGLGTSFAFMFLGIASARMEADEARKFRLNTLALSKMGHIGLTLLLVSGTYLMTPYWSSLSSMPMLTAKLILVLLLIGLIGLVTIATNKAKKGDADAQFKKIEPLGKLSLITTLIIVMLAVYTFH